jgi:hypothetical protein
MSSEKNTIPTDSGVECGVGAMYVSPPSSEEVLALVTNITKFSNRATILTNDRDGTGAATFVDLSRAPIEHVRFKERLSGLSIEDVKLKMTLLDGLKQTPIQPRPTTPTDIAKRPQSGQGHGGK